MSSLDESRRLEAARSRSASLDRMIRSIRRPRRCSPASVATRPRTWARRRPGPASRGNGGARCNELRTASRLTRLSAAASSSEGAANTGPVSGGRGERDLRERLDPFEVTGGVVAKTFERKRQHVLPAEDPVEQVDEAVELEKPGIERREPVITPVQRAKKILDSADAADPDLLKPDRSNQVVPLRGAPTIRSGDEATSPGSGRSFEFASSVLGAEAIRCDDT